MSVTQQQNSKANIKKPSVNDIPFSASQPVLASTYAVSTANQSVINLTFSVDTVNLSDQFFLFVDGKKLRLGASNDYTFSAVGSDGTSSQVTLSVGIPAGFNIQAYMLGLKKESEFQTDNRFVQLYEAQGNGFQSFVNQSTTMNATATAGAPTAGTFYSSISGRAAMPDLAQDLRVRMGINRVMAQSLAIVQNEFGPNGEYVWTYPNDGGGVRFVGTWFAVSDGIGQRCATLTSGDFVEVTFYGTGLNLLCAPSSNTRDWRVSVDGGAEGSNILGTADGSATLYQRKYAPNIIVNMVSGLALGVHTVKIRQNNTVGFDIFGFEFLAQTTALTVNPGVAYSQGKKYSSTAAQTLAHNSAVTGTRGGRTVVYQKADGTVGAAFTPVNAATAFLAATDHTNEEVSRVYNWREFGAGRADDFSNMNPASGSQGAAFTLDDGTTTLMGNGVDVYNSGGYEGVGFAVLNGFFLFTFVGTGLDINCLSIGLGGACTLNVDGVDISTAYTPGGGGLVRSKVASGLPYGTHTVRVTDTSLNAGTLLFLGYTVYQPKKPSIPAGTVELADYNNMASYVVGNLDYIGAASSGVIRKSITREFNYTGTTPIQSSFIVYNTGWAIDNPVGSYVEYTFFGTGFDIRNYSGNSATNSVTISLNGTAMTAANFPTMATSTWLGNTFNATTAVLNTAAGAGVATAGFGVTGLPLAKYTVRFANTASNGLSFELYSLDIVTPVYSTKSTVPTDIQSTLSVGSQSIGDTRKLTPIKDASLRTKNVVYGNGVSSVSVTAGQYVPIPDMCATISVGPNARLDISFDLGHQNSTVGGYCDYAIFVDGLQAGGNAIMQTQTASNTLTITLRRIVPVAAGVHRVAVYWKSYGTTSSPVDVNTGRNIVVVEL